MKTPKALSKMSLATLREFKFELIAAIESGEPKNWNWYISGKQLDPDAYGEMDDVNKELLFTSDQTLQDVIDTLIHEYLHVLLPRAKHKYVYRLSEAITKQLTSSDKERLFRALAIRATWDD